MREITDRQLLAFRRFLSALAHGQDAELVLLKGHILIEEQVRLLIERRLCNPQALREPNAELECNQAIRLAQAFFPPGYRTEVWQAIAKLNKMRNDIAHNILSREGLNDQMWAWAESFPTGFNEFTDKALRFEATLWSLFDAVSELVDTPNAEVLQMPAGDSKP